MSKLPAPDEHFPVVQSPSAPRNDLDPPIYSNPVLNVVGADRGLGVRHLDTYLYVTIMRWTNLQAGDTCEYFHGSRTLRLGFHTVKPEETGKSFFQLAINEESVPRGLSSPVFVRLVRNGPGTPSTSDDLTVFVKDTRPGLDEQPGLGYHDKLLLSLPDDLAAPGAVLTPERAAQGVVFTLDYPGKRVRDKILLYWDTITQVVVFELDDDHASGAKPIEVEVPASVIGTGSGLIPIRYQVLDEVENRSGHVEHFSQAVHVQAELDPSLLRRARFLVGTTSVTSVNYDQDAGKFFAVQVVTPFQLPDGRFVPANARVIATLGGTRVDESTFELDLPDQGADPGWPTSFPVDDGIIKQLIQGSMKITWRLEFPLGTVLAKSQSLTILISGTIADMPAVTVVQADAGLIDPNEPFITINYPNPAYTPYDPDSLVRLRMEAVLPGGGLVDYEQPHIAGAPPPPTRFRTVTQANFTRFIGLGDVRVFYTVDDGLMRALGTGTQAIRESEPTYVRFGERIAEMPRPEIDRVDENHNLDPDDLLGQLDITLPYAMTFDGDVFAWRLSGTAADGSTHGDIRLNRATAGAPVPFSLCRHYADTNLGGVIRLSYSLIPANGGRTLRSEILEVTVGKALGDLPRPEVLEASKAPDQLAPEAVTAGATIRVTLPQMLPTDRIRACWTGIPDIGSHCETKDGDTRKTVDFTVPPQVVGANIAPFGQRINVQYFLIRNGRETPSPILDLLLLNLTTLPIPTIEGIGDTPVLDTSRLNGTERTMINIWHFIHRAQRMWMEYSGTYDTVPETPYFEATYTNNLVTQEGEASGIQPPTPVDELRKLKDGTPLTIRFWVCFDRSFNKANAVLFRERHYIVQGLPGVLPHPLINGTTDTGPNVTVDPLPIEHNTTATIRYTGMSGRDRITFCWYFDDGTCHSVIESGLDGGTVVFNLTSAKVLHRSVNSTVCLKYSVEREGVDEPIPSEVQTVKVNTILPADLPQPRINNIAPGGTLDLETFTGNGVCSVNKWPLSAVGHRIWITCVSAGVAPLHVLTADGALVSPTEAANGLANKPVLRSWLNELPNNSQIIVTVEIKFNGSSDKINSVQFPSTTYTVIRPALSIDKTPMRLKNLQVIQNYGWPVHPYAPSTRRAEGGVPPYTYSSSNSRFAQVSETAGAVIGIANGNAIITATDATGEQVSYPVTVENIYRLQVNNTFMDPVAARNWIASVGGITSPNDGALVGSLVSRLTYPGRDLFNSQTGYNNGIYWAHNSLYPQYILSIAMTTQGWIGGANVGYTDTLRLRAMAIILT